MLLTRRYSITLIILLIGLSSAVVIYAMTDNRSEHGLIYEWEHSKVYKYRLELYGGKMNVLASEFRQWFSGLWQGKSLAFTIAGITVFAALVYFFFLSGPKADCREENNRDRNG